ncbi:hypothetical protein HYX12_01110, partial [Candidatus Woesearchaeota archaeon]|nr:hypothetical protein [Candidatus Woesearchaeota archaeon]
AYRLPDRAAPEQLKLLLEKIVQKDYDARGTASDALDHLIEQRLVEDGLLSQKGIIETVESKLRERLGAKQRPKSHDEVIAFRHLRLASTYARMRNEQGMKLELDAADYSARLAGKDIESQVTGTYQLFDASVIDYAKQIIKNVVVIDGKTLEGLSETPDGRDFRQIVPTLHYMIQIVFQRENLPLTPERTATIDQYFHQRVSEEVKMYIDTQLNTLGRAMQRREGLPQIGRINQKLAEYRSLAEATGARWDQEEVQKLVFNK